jgi:hypothetical protein
LLKSLPFVFRQNALLLAANSKLIDGNAHFGYCVAAILIAEDTTAGLWRLKSPLLLDIV